MPWRAARCGGGARRRRREREKEREGERGAGREKSLKKWRKSKDRRVALQTGAGACRCALIPLSLLHTNNKFTRAGKRKKKIG